MYKVRVNEDYFKPIFKTVDFKTACQIKGVSSKTGPWKRPYKAIQKDRIYSLYPDKVSVAKMLKVPELPHPDTDEQPSSQEATKAYIKHMYGIDAVITPEGVIY